MPQAITLLTSSGIGLIYAAFFRGNVGFVTAVVIFMVLEMGFRMAAAFLNEHDLDAKWFLKFWVERMALLVSPVIAMGIDYAIHWASEPDTPLGAEVVPLATKAAFLSLFVFQLMLTTKALALVRKDFPLVKRLMWILDRMDRSMTQTEPPDEWKRDYDQQKEKEDGDASD